MSDRPTSDFLVCDRVEEMMLRQSGVNAAKWGVTLLVSMGMSLLFLQLSLRVLFFALAPLVVWSVVSSAFWIRQYRDLESRAFEVETLPEAEQCLNAVTKTDT